MFIHDRVPEVLGDDVEVIDRCDLHRQATQAGLGRIEDRVVPIREQPQPEHAQACRANGQGDGPNRSPSARVSLIGQRPRRAHLQDQAVNREQERPDDRRGRAVGQPEEPVAGDWQQRDDHDQPAGGREHEGRLSEQPPPAGHRPSSAQNAQSDDHGNDQAELLDHLARVLEGVDQEPKDEPRHEGEDWAAQSLRQRPQAQEHAGDIHQRHQGEPGERTPGESADCSGSPAFGHLG